MEVTAVDQTTTPTQNAVASSPEPKKKPVKKVAVIALVVLAIAVVAVASAILAKKYLFPPKTKPASSPTTSTPSSPFKANFSFAEYKIDTTPFKPSLPEYNITAAELSNLPNFETSQGAVFSENQKNALNQSHFFIATNLDKFYGDNPDEFSQRNDDWTWLYQKIGGSWSIYDRKPENAVFITSDFLLHVYHRLLEKEWEYIEQKEFYPRLKEMTDKLVNQAIIHYGQSADPENKESYERIIAFFSTAKAILDSAYEESTATEIADKNLDTQENVLAKLDGLQGQVPTNSYSLAEAEIKLIMDQSKLYPSPIFGKLMSETGLVDLHDYTQYGPRSHYNKNSVLRVYFRTMMWYGRANFALKSAELTRDAIHITQLVKATNQLKNWEDIYEPTGFFVGKSDDLGIYEYGAVADSLAVSAVNDETVSQVQQELAKYEGPQIMSSAIVGEKVFGTTKEELQEETKGFHFMGQRFTPDAFIFSTLTQGSELPDPETGERLPSTPTALMVMKIMGNQTAAPLVDNWISQNAPSSTHVLANRMTTLKQQFDQISQDIWTQNIYWGWLYTIKGLFTESLDKTGYPSFMKNEAWNKKDLQASLGSWTELKHDTLLYAKQSYAELGAGGPEGEIPPVPKGYVEPNIHFLDRLVALTQMTKDGLISRGLLDNEFQGRNENLIDSLKFFKTIAVKEIQNETISDEDFEKLRLKGGQLELILRPLPNEEQTEGNARAALIADVHTDVLKGQILYEADGIPNYIYVAVKDSNGVRLTKGLAFSYFEFNHPLGERLTDETWRKMNYTIDKNSLPLIPDWSASLIK